MILRSLPLLVSLALLASPSAGAQDASSPPPDETPNGHDRMLALLKSIAEQAAESDPFLGDGNSKELIERLDSLPARATRRRWQILKVLGFDALRLGDSETAIGYYERAVEKGTLLGRKLPVDLNYQMRADLALAYLRWGETENCVRRHTEDSCLLPIQGEGWHADPRGSRGAIKLYRELLAERPADASARWLLNIAYMTVGEYPEGVPEELLIEPEVFSSGVDFPRFHDVAPDKGVASFNLSGGSVVDDFNGDGHVDIVTSTWDSTVSMQFFAGDGQGNFEDHSEDAGFAGLTGGLNLLHADYDNDGDLDVLVLRGAWLRQRGRVPNSLLRNDGAGHFTDVTFDAGLGEAHYPTQTASWGDYDLDGDLDLYIGNEFDPVLKARCQLFRNEGDGTFTDVAREAGVENGRYTKGVMWGDFDADRDPDLYVSNSNEANRLYRNNGDGTFTDIAVRLGVEKPKASFATWFWDENNDGVLDIFVASYLPMLKPCVASYLGMRSKAELHAMYRGDGEGGFDNVSKEMGLTHSAIVMGSNFGDLDNDGWLDFYLGTGYPGYEGILPNLMYWNRGGERFDDVSAAGGFGHLQKGHAVSFADLDGDGDQDVYIEMGGAFPGDKYGNALFENPGFGNHWIDVRLIGTTSNSYGIGARIHCTIQGTEGPREIYRWVCSGGSFGGNPLTQSIGLGKAERIKRLEVYWPASDLTQTLENVGVDQRIEITEPTPAEEGTQDEG